MPLHVQLTASKHGVLRLRSCFAKRSSYSAQDDRVGRGDFGAAGMSIAHVGRTLLSDGVVIAAHAAEGTHPSKTAKGEAASFEKGSKGGPACQTG